VLSFDFPRMAGVIFAMSENGLPIAVDAMGGDHAPDEVVAGAIDTGHRVILVGDENRITPLLSGPGVKDRIEVVHTTTVVSGDDPPFQAFRSKKDSSMMTSIRLVKEGRASGVMSPGNTGAFMAGATMILGRFPEVSRPAAAIPIPTPDGQMLLLDAGASTDCTTSDLLNFAVMGSTYVKVIWGVGNPRIGLLSIGEEESKGTKQAREAHKFLKTSGLNFIGNVEGSDLGSSGTDVIVTDGFTGNVALKAVEGISSLIMNVVRDELGLTRGLQRMASAILYPVFKRIKGRLDWQEYGGGALLGVRGNVVIAHGKSNRRAISSAIKLAASLSSTHYLEALEKGLREFHKVTKEADKVKKEPEPAQPE